MIRIGVNLYDHSMRARGQGRQGQGRYDRAHPGSVARIGDHRQVGPLPHQGYGIQVQRMPGGPLEGPDASFAEHYLVVAVG